MTIAELPHVSPPPNQGRPSLKPLLGLWPRLLAHPRMLALAAAALLMSSLTMLAIPMAVRRMIDAGFSANDIQLIDQYFAMLVLLGLVLALASSGRFFCVTWLGERIVADIRTEVFGHLARLSPAFFEQTHSGELMSRLTADTTQIKAAAGSALSQALRNSIMLIGALVLMFVTSVQLSLLVLVAIPAIALPLVAYGRLVRRLSRRAQDTLADAAAYASENLSAIRTLQSSTHETIATARFGRAVEEAFFAAQARLTARAGLTAIVIFLVVACVVGVLWFGATLVIGGEMSGGRLAQFVLYALFAAGAMAELSEVWGEAQQAAGAAERLTELLAVRPQITSPARPMALPEPARGAVEFRDVDFNYASKPTLPALRGVSFRIEPGETVAIVGPSGAGKSTIFSLILRFYDPASGQVLIDGVPIHQAELTRLRERIALVPQDVAIFADTIAENIRYGAGHSSRADVIRAAEVAQADEFIRILAHGYDTKVGERGVTLSGGQRQRIALARAILRNAAVLLLDEATSALDAESEQAVQRALERVTIGRTTLIIAHRLATIQKADRILVLDDGRIVEHGTHADLVRGSGLYRRLAELQFVAEAV